MYVHKKNHNHQNNYIYKKNKYIYKNSKLRTIAWYVYIYDEFIMNECKFTHKSPNIFIINMYVSLSLSVQHTLHYTATYSLFFFGTK